MKSKIYFIILVAISYQTILFSQEFAPVGAKWYFPTFNYINADIGLSVFESIGDTIIDNKPCKVIYKNNQSCYSPGLNHYVHQRNDSIFRYDEDLGEFKLLIIQNTQIGDIWTIPASPQLETDSMHCVIDSISYFYFNSTDSIKVQHVTLKAIDPFNADSNGITIYSDSVPFKLYEGIGFNTAIFPIPWNTLCDAEHEQEIRCYEDGDIGLVKFSEDDCNLTPTKEIHSNFKIEIYPNPATNHLIIQSKYNLINKIELINLQGKAIKTIVNVTPSIDLSDLENGFYVLKVYVENEAVLKKIIIQN